VVRLSLPLMIGVSLVSADSWIIAHFASKTDGAVSLMTYAKQLFTAPMAMLAQAAGAASMPFFASLWTKQRHYEFATGVADSVSRVAALGLLGASAMVALAAPLVELLFMGDVSPSATRESVPSTSPSSPSACSVSAQAIYSRAFYAAGTPSSPWRPERWLRWSRCPSITGFITCLSDGVGGCLGCWNRAADRFAGRAVTPAAHGLAGQPGLCGVGPVPAGRRGKRRWGLGALRSSGPCAAQNFSGPDLLTDLTVLLAGTALWVVVVKWVLEKSGSALPRVTMKRLGWDKTFWGHFQFIFCYLL